MGPLLWQAAEETTTQHSTIGVTRSRDGRTIRAGRWSTHLTMISVSPEKAPCCPEGAAADLSAAAIASVATPR